MLEHETHDIPMPRNQSNIVLKRLAKIFRYLDTNLTLPDPGSIFSYNAPDEDGVTGSLVNLGLPTWMLGAEQSPIFSSAVHPFMTGGLISKIKNTTTTLQHRI